MDLKDLTGKKTYIMAVATICYAVGGMVAGYVPFSVGIPLVLGALGLSALRDAFTKPEPEPKEEIIAHPPQ